MHGTKVSPFPFELLVANSPFPHFHSLSQEKHLDSLKQMFIEKQKMMEMMEKTNKEGGDKPKEEEKK